MPNHIKNRITLNGSVEKIGQLIDSFSTIETSKLYRSFDDRIICKGPNQSVGWFDEKTGNFESLSNRGVAILGLPEGYEFEITESFTRFPDFNKIFEMPEILRGSTSPNRTNAKECIEATGFESWYDWSREKWGTKWNAYSCERLSINVYQFETAWCGVPDLIIEMSELHPEVEIFYEYSDEDTGYNCGQGTFKGGEHDFVTLEGGSIEAFELAFKLRPDYEESYELVDGEYKYKEE